MQLLCIGDVAISDVEQIENNWESPLGKTPDADHKVLFNWEFPIGTVLNSTPRSSGKRFLSHPDSIPIIQHWAPGFASLATNHMLDAGNDGLGDTIDKLQKAGFEVVGAGRTKEEIQKPLTWETNEGRLIIVNWVFAETHPDWQTIPGVNCWPGTEEASRIAHELRGQADWLMALLHWSDELFAYPRIEDRLIAKDLVEMGFDVIVSHHPHVVRGMEVIRTVPVFYSLGNFYFSNEYDQRTNRVELHAPRNREALGIKLSFQRGKKPEYEPVSFWQESDRFQIDQRLRAQKRLYSNSKPLGNEGFESYGKWYDKKRRIFDLWSGKWHFVVRRFGIIGMVRYIMNKITRGISSV